MHTLAPVAPNVSLKSISDGESSGSRRVTIQWTPSGIARYEYFITVIPPIPQCMNNSSVCSSSSTVMDLNVNLGIEYKVSVRAERCKANVTSEESKFVSFNLTGIVI